MAPNAGLQSEKVVDYLKQFVEPVTFQDLIAQFSSPKDSNETRRELGDQLKNILISCVNAGSIMHCNNHFYAATHAEDVQKVFDFNANVDSGSDNSEISYSSCESIVQKKPNNNDFMDCEEELAVNLSSLSDVPTISNSYSSAVASEPSLPSTSKSARNASTYDVKTKHKQI
ncbi:uncharacterized protein LOC117134853 [Drosophila busckii]|uniref:uncharacterized protein LOC117134853 n=1 Tax=Drosophila busckii TaxID=30019 RepID=UPI0014331E80|nr:uncharacterized protein LOC117134853 [Drosophila busckii]